MGGKTSAESINKYMAKTYDRINLVVPKGRKAELQAAAERRGESLNGFINKAIQRSIDGKEAAE